jgi:hypothetical protein
MYVLHPPVIEHLVVIVLITLLDHAFVIRRHMQLGVGIADPIRRVECLVPAANTGVLAVAF